MRRGVEILRKHGIPPQRLVFYVLSGYNTALADDEARVRILRELGTDVYVMTYELKTQPRLVREFGGYGRKPRFNKKCTFKQYVKYRRLNYERLVAEYEEGR